MKRLLLFVLPLLLIASCAEEKEIPPPDNVLPEATMVQVMLDIQLIEGAFHKRVIKADNNRKEALEGYVKVYDKYHITQAKFDSSYSWYLEDPHRMDRLLDQVMEELSKLQAQTQSEKELR